MRIFADVGHIRYIESSASISVSKLCNFHLPYLGTFGALLRLQYMQIHIEAFPQSCKYGRYLSFGTLVNSITVWGAFFIKGI